MTEKKSAAKFIKTAIFAKDYPQVVDLQGHTVSEVAVVGRSNVGKSSLLNHLFQVKNLVKTSSSPGKTRAVNFFSFGNQLTFADLPGYGYAKVSKEIKKTFEPMIVNYLKDRAELKLILLLLDIRRTPSEEDVRFLDYLAKLGKAVIVVFTKVDKLSQNKVAQQVKLNIGSFTATNLHFVKYSAHKNVGRKELLNMIFEAVASETEENSH